MRQTKISVIIPIYNAGSYLYDTLSNICSQTMKDIEILCVDDGSVDNSADIVRYFISRDRRLKLYTKEHSNAGDARNLGLENAQGEYVSFLDADDLFEATMLQDAYELAVKYGTDIVVYRSDVIDDSTHEVKDAKWTIKESNLPLSQAFKSLDVVNVFNTFADWAWDKLFKRQTIENAGVRFQSQTCVNDSFFVKSMIAFSDKISVLDEVLVHKRINAKNSITSSFIAKKGWKCSFNAISSLREQLIRWDKYQCFEEDYINFAMRYIVENADRYITSDMLTELLSDLKNVWIKKLGINIDDPIAKECLYYNQVRDIISLSANDYKWRYLRYIIGDYLFPFEIVPPHSRIVIYGAGKVGISYYRQVSFSRYAQVCAWVDKNHEALGEEVCGLDELGKVSFDYVVIAIANLDQVIEVKKTLLNIGIDEDILIWRKPEISLEGVV